mmetsp:Transcript_23057/g.19634  ORF Transcript_23057/g.19634 Transcript_23057/m.19634 type:complete len:85 (+) Transcript_23057:152-406(+)
MGRRLFLVFSLVPFTRPSKYHINRITIVPIGLNYFEPYRFRSSLICEFGRPVVVEKDSDLYREYINPDTHRQAVSSLMQDFYIH